MSVIKPGFLKVLEAKGDESVNVIIRTDDLSEENKGRVATLGLTVTRTTTLIKMIAATGPARAVIALASEPWVTSIEPDRIVSANDFGF